MTDLLTSAVGFLRSLWPSRSTALLHLMNNLVGHHRIFIGGLDNAGKTSLLYKHLAKPGEAVLQIIPTIAFNVEVYRYRTLVFQAMDISCGRPGSFRHAERAFFYHANAIIWVLDASDDDRYEEGKIELYSIALHSSGMRESVPLLVLANKQDLPNARTPDQVAADYFHDMPVGRRNQPCKVFATNIETGEGLLEAFTWLSKTIEACTFGWPDVIGNGQKLREQDEILAIFQDAFGNSQSSEASKAHEK